MNDLIFLDSETTGLDPDDHEIWEIAWAINDGNVESTVFEHSLRKADPKALEMNGYANRAYAGIELPLGQSWDLAVRSILSGNTLVCANPTFDRMFMRNRWGYEPYHYRSIDIESMALLVFSWSRPRGLKDVAAELNKLGFEVGEPDHSAREDVLVTRNCYNALRRLRLEWGGSA